MTIQAAVDAQDNKRVNTAILHCYMRSAATALGMKNFDEAETMLELSLARVASEYDELMVLFALAQVYIESGKFQIAQTFVRNLAYRAEHICGPESKQYLDAIKLLARVSEGQFKQINREHLSYKMSQDAPTSQSSSADRYNLPCEVEELEIVWRG